jgi:hypothetical protein
MLESLIEVFFLIISIVVRWIFGAWYAIIDFNRSIIEYIKNIFKNK